MGSPAVNFEIEPPDQATKFEIEPPEQKPNLRESSPDYGSTGFEAYGEALQTPEARTEQTKRLKGMAPLVVGTGVGLIDPPLGAPAYLATKGLVAPDVVAAHPYQTAFETASFPATEYGGKALGAAGRAATESPVGQKVLAAGGAALKKLPGSAIRRIPYIGNVASDMYEAGRAAIAALPKGEVPAPEISTPSAPINVRTPGQIAPEMIRPRAYPARIPEPIPARPGLLLKGEVPPPEATPRATLGKQLEGPLREAVGNKPVRPGVRIRDQFKETPAANLPEGHTPVKSSAVKSYKYDPATQELHVTTGNGTIYVSGEVSPAQAEAFRTAESKGQAWKAIRDNSPLVAKIPAGGTRIASKGASEFRSAAPEPATKPSEYGPPKLDFLSEYGGVPPENQGFNFAPAEDVGNKVRAETQRQLGPVSRGKAEEDLTPLLKKSLEAVKKGKKR